MDIPWVAHGVSVLVFFASLYGVDRLLAIRAILSSREQGFPKQVVGRFTAPGWLAVVASGLVVLAVMVSPAWGFIVEHTRNRNSAGAWCGLGWLVLYGITAAILNGFGVRVYRDNAKGNDQSNAGGFGRAGLADETTSEPVLTGPVGSSAWSSGAGTPMQRAPVLVLICGALSAAFGGVLLLVSDRVEGLIWLAAAITALGLVLLGLWLRSAVRRPVPEGPVGLPTTPLSGRSTRSRPQPP
jgi:hypothetical protein